MLTLGSLFDGIGGWQLAAIRAGIKPIWSSEIDRFPIAVTKKHFPNTLQLGDIKNIIGSKIPKVDIVTMGSPCQNLSIAGNREGFNGKESGLFKEAIRIIRELHSFYGGVHQDLSYGKTYAEHSVQIKGWILNLCLNRSQKPKFQCLNLENGQKQDWYEAVSVRLPGECLILNTSESPTIEKEYSLLRILIPERDVPQKSFLSARACQGILMRAEAAKKKLKGMFRIALMNQANE